MRNEWDETALIDRYLLHELDDTQRQAVEAHMLSSESFSETVESQRTAHRLIRLYGRREDRRRLEAIYRRLLDEAAFSRRITNLFFRR